MQDLISKNKNLFLTISRIIKTFQPGYQMRFFHSFLLNELFLSRIKRKWIQKKEGIWVPSSINFSPTMRCNLTCRGCYAADYSQDEELPLPLMDRLIEEAKGLGIYSVGFLGGEPLLRKDIFKLFNKHSDVAFRLVTNGLLIDREVISYLKSLGNVLTIISLEGFKENTDNWRGQGVYEKLMRLMERLKRERIIFGFSITVTRENYDEVKSKDFLDFMIKKGSFFGNFFIYGPLGRNPDFNLLISKEERFKFFKDLDDLEKKRSIVLIKEGYVDGGFLNKGCGPARETLHILPDGGVEPCAGIHFSRDNIKTRSLREILSSPFLGAIREEGFKNSGNCLIMSCPFRLKEIIQNYEASPTHKNLWDQFQNYCRFCLESEKTKKEQVSPEEIKIGS